MDIGKIISDRLAALNQNQVWLASKLNWNFKTLNGKITRSSFDWEELLKVALVLKIDLNELKNSIMEDDEEMKKEVASIFKGIQNKTVDVDFITDNFTGNIMIESLHIQEINDEEIKLSDNEVDPENLTKVTVSFDFVDTIEEDDDIFKINMTDGSIVSIRVYNFK